MRTLRQAGRLVHARPAENPFDRGANDRVDSWLEQFHGRRLRRIDAACADGQGEQRYALFRDLDDVAWAVLLSWQYELYPHIRAVLPTMPEPALQEIWNGASGLALASQTTSFYTNLRSLYAKHGARPLSESSVLDFGCGWGRLTRYLLRDVARGRLYGCDPVEGILDICRANGVAANFATTEFLPERLPFDEPFDLAFAYSVFTHLSEAAHEASLRALYESLQPGGILIATIRPPEYLYHCDALRPVVESLGRDPDAALALPRYLFVPHLANPQHPQTMDAGQIEYGETVITMSYVRERWSRWFELLEADDQPNDLHQVVLTLRRRAARSG
jgi:SAM-dependent methyltransferase